MSHRNFRLYFTGQTLSFVGWWVQITAMSWLVWRITDSALALGFIQFIGQIPTLFFAPLGGVIADRYSRHRLVIVTQFLVMGQAFALSALTLLGYVHLPVLAALAFVLGSIMAFNIPARQAFIIELVGKDDLASAIALNSILFNAARIAGPSIAGIVLAVFSVWLSQPEGVCFFLNGVFYTLVIVMLFRIRLKARVIEPQSGGVLRNIQEALQFVRGNTAIRDVLLCMGVISFLGFPFQALLAAVADGVLGHGAGGFAILQASVGLGAVLGALLLARRLPAPVDQGRFLGLAGLGFGAGLTLFSFSHNFWLSAFLVIPTGMGTMIQAAGTNTFLQVLVPDRLRGRIMSFFVMTLLGMMALGNLMMGYLAQRFGDPLAAIRLGGIGVLLASLVLLWRLPQIRASVQRLQDMV